MSSLSPWYHDIYWLSNSHILFLWSLVHWVHIMLAWIIWLYCGNDEVQEYPVVPMLNIHLLQNLRQCYTFLAKVEHNWTTEQELRVLVMTKVALKFGRPIDNFNWGAFMDSILHIHCSRNYWACPPMRNLSYIPLKEAWKYFYCLWRSAITYGLTRCLSVASLEVCGSSVTSGECLLAVTYIHI